MNRRINGSRRRIKWELVIPALGTIIALCAFLWEIYIYAPPIKNMGYAVLERQPVVNEQAMFSSHVSVLKDGHIITDTYVVKLRIQNTGKVPISKQDFDSGLLINWGKSAQVLEVKIVDGQSMNLNPSVQIGTFHADKFVAHSEGPCIQIEPALFNPGWYIDLVILVNQPDVLPAIMAQIVGVSQIQQIRS